MGRSEYFLNPTIGIATMFGVQLPTRDSEVAIKLERILYEGLSNKLLKYGNIICKLMYTNIYGEPVLKL